MGDEAAQELPTGTRVGEYVDPAQRPRAAEVRERLLAFRTTILKAATQTMPRVDARR